MVTVIKDRWHGKQRKVNQLYLPSQLITLANRSNTDTSNVLNVAMISVSIIRLVIAVLAYVLALSLHISVSEAYLPRCSTDITYSLHRQLTQCQNKGLFLKRRYRHTKLRKHGTTLNYLKSSNKKGIVNFSTYDNWIIKIFIIIVLWSFTVRFTDSETL